MSGLIKVASRLYRFNPWQDTAHGICKSFDLYRQQPVDFFMQRFPGMTIPVAEYLAEKVFCILDDPKDDSQRVEARDFGLWIKDLPSLLADPSTSGSKQVVSMSSTQGFTIASSAPLSRRSQLRQTSINMDLEGQNEEISSRSASITKRRKRGARKGKGSGVPTSQPLHLGTSLETLMAVSRSLTREISNASQSSSNHRDDLPLKFPDRPPILTPTAPTKKASKWTLSFGQNSSSRKKQLPSSVDEAGSLETNTPTSTSATAANVTNLIMGLTPPPLAPSGDLRSTAVDADQSSLWDKDHHRKLSVPRESVGASQVSPPMTQGDSDHFAPQPYNQRATSHLSEPSNSLLLSSTSSGRAAVSDADSIASSNWRTSPSDAASLFSTFSSQSSSSQGTSVSSSSWRTGGSTYKDNRSPDPPTDNPTRQLPKNVKSEYYYLASAHFY
jgi:hypothetical protein